jgi:hypothetical protein
MVALGGLRYSSCWSSPLPAVEDLAPRVFIVLGHCLKRRLLVAASRKVDATGKHIVTNCQSWRNCKG